MKIQFGANSRKRDLQSKKQADNRPVSLELPWISRTCNMRLPFEEELALVFRATCHWQSCNQLRRSRAEFRFRADELEGASDAVARIKMKDVP